jgi:hypothetical protein
MVGCCKQICGTDPVYFKSSGTTQSGGFGQMIKLLCFVQFTCLFDLNMLTTFYIVVSKGQIMALSCFLQYWTTDLSWWSSRPTRYVIIYIMVLCNYSLHLVLFFFSIHIRLASDVWSNHIQYDCFCLLPFLFWNLGRCRTMKDAT